MGEHEKQATTDEVHHEPSMSIPGKSILQTLSGADDSASPVVSAASTMASAAPATLGMTAEAPRGYKRKGPAHNDQVSSEAIFGITYPLVPTKRRKGDHQSAGNSITAGWSGPIPRGVNTPVESASAAPVDIVLSSATVAAATSQAAGRSSIRVTTQGLQHSSASGSPGHEYTPTIEGHAINTSQGAFSRFFRPPFIPTSVPGSTQHYSARQYTARNTSGSANFLHPGGYIPTSASVTPLPTQALVAGAGAYRTPPLGVNPASATQGPNTLGLGLTAVVPHASLFFFANNIQYYDANGVDGTGDPFYQGGLFTPGAHDYPPFTPTELSSPAGFDFAWSGSS